MATNKQNSHALNSLERIIHTISNGDMIKYYNNVVQTATTTTTTTTKIHHFWQHTNNLGAKRYQGSQEDQKSYVQSTNSNRLEIAHGTQVFTFFTSLTMCNIQFIPCNENWNLRYHA